MKSLLFIGATLMVGAGIYGFVDYKKKNESKQFKALYKEEKPVVQQPTQQPAPEVVTSPVPAVVAQREVENKKNAAKMNVKSKPPKFSPKQFSRAIPTEEAIEEMVVPAEEEPAPPKKEL
jgi:hypothetical protein